MATKTTKVDELKVSIELKGVKAKLQAARVGLMEKSLKKTGKNDFAHFDFFQLKDFLPEAQRIFTKLGVTTQYTIMPRVIANIERVENGVAIKEPIIRDIARLVVKDIETEEELIFEMEAAPVQIGNNTKQNIYQAAGGRSTYYKRYLYRDALEIEEDDESDNVLGQPGVDYQTVPTQPVTPYSFQAPQPAPIQQAIVEQSIGQPVVIGPDGGTYSGFVPQVEGKPLINQPGNLNLLDNPQQMEQKVEAVLDDAIASTEQNLMLNQPISQASKEEAMNLIISKGLNGFEVISNYCQQNGIASPSELKEKDKAGLIAYIGTL